MLRTDDRETEILLGNKQLMGIFFVVAILLGVAFYGGYMVGKAAPKKAATGLGSSVETASTSTLPDTSAGGETHTLPGDTSSPSANNPTDATEPDKEAGAEPPLGAPKAKRTASSAVPSAENAELEPSKIPARPLTGFVPEAGQQFLQVAAVGREQARGVADVLHAKGFRAHAVPKPGDPKIYRVLIGPLRDAGDLSATRDALRQIGFREVIVQKY